MREREPNNQSFEEAYASLQEAIRLVLTGYRRSVDILSKLRNPWIGKTKVFFLSSSSVSPEIAHRAVEELKNELEVDYRKRFEIRGASSLDRHYRVGPTIAFQTGEANIVIARREVYKESRRGELAGVIWSIENLEPMGLGGIIYQKSQEIIQRARESVVGGEQDVQP